MPFDPLKDNFSLPALEEQVLEFWDSEQVFEKSLDAAKNRPHFVFYEGPPTANGRPGIHHVISRTVKDLICRYKAMNGYRVDRKAGWDTHGLPVELEVEKKLKLTNKQQIVEYGIGRFTEECRKSVFTYLEDWNRITRRIGYWLDLDDAYVTLTNEYIESVWHILKTLYDRDLLYKGHKTLPYCPRCGTGLSSHEVAQGYNMIKDPSVFITVKAADGDFSYLVWTTTPWTLPSNAALAMKADADYVMVDLDGRKLVVADALAGQVIKEEFTVLSRHKGSEFAGRKYVPLFDTFPEAIENAYYVITADFVTLDDGTGIVHIAPGYGADDYEVGRQYKLPVLQAVGNDGRFKSTVEKYAGKWIKDADTEISRDLKEAGQLYKKEQYEHNYPFCWRCDSPLIYIAQPSWYIKTTQFRDRLIANNNSINWHPDEIRSGRMLNWLENNVDWALSRERFWGTPLPIWICDEESCGAQRAVGSIEQLRAEAINLPADVDLHKPMMDEVKLRCTCGGSMTRVPEVIDVWFDSGAMPYAQWHYPFEHKDEFATRFPADFISEAVDQTRGWFYSLLAIGTLLFDKAPFKNVVVLEFILDKHGKKMSKSRGNVVDPFETVDKFGADAVRWYLVSTSNPWLPTRFDLDGLTEVVRKYFDTLRNTYSFFAIYANIDNIQERAVAAGQPVDAFLESLAGPPEKFDRWIISKFNSLIREVADSFDAYDITRPVRAIQHFVIEELSNWYVRNNRRRFWAEANDPSKMRAYLTLHRVLTGVCRLSAPVSPFLADKIWTELMGPERCTHGLPLSVHMDAYPKADESLIDTELEETMNLAERIVSLGRAARSRTDLKVRQPLAALLLRLPRGVPFTRIESLVPIIKDELNIKKVDPVDSLDDRVRYSAKLNFKTAAPRLGKNVKAVAAALEQLDHAAVVRFTAAKTLSLAVDGGSIELSLEEVEIRREDTGSVAVEADGSLMIGIETKLDESLIDEGFAREIVNKVQNMRKQSKLEVTDHIDLSVSTADPLARVVRKNDEYIRRETLATTLNILQPGALPNGTEWNINGEKAVISVNKVS